MADAVAKVSDVVGVGNPDLWMLVCKACSKEQKWMKSTKVMNAPTGMFLQVTTQYGDSVAESVTFAPGLVAVRTTSGSIEFQERA